MLFTIISCSESFNIDLPFGDSELDSINPGIDNAFASTYLPMDSEPILFKHTTVRNSMPHRLGNLHHLTYERFIPIAPELPRVIRDEYLPSIAQWPLVPRENGCIPRPLDPTALCARLSCQIPLTIGLFVGFVGLNSWRQGLKERERRCAFPPYQERLPRSS